MQRFRLRCFVVSGDHGENPKQRRNCRKWSEQDEEQIARSQLKELLTQIAGARGQYIPPEYWERGNALGLREGVTAVQILHLLRQALQEGEDSGRVPYTLDRLIEELDGEDHPN